MKFIITLLLAFALVNSAVCSLQLLANVGKAGKNFMDTLLGYPQKDDDNKNSDSDLQKMLENMKFNVNANKPSGSGSDSDSDSDLMKQFQNMKNSDYSLSIGVKFSKTVKECPGGKQADNLIDVISKALDALDKDLGSLNYCKDVQDAWQNLKDALSKSLDFVDKSKNLFEALKTLFNEKVTNAAMKLLNALNEMEKKGVSIAVALKQTISTLKGIFLAAVKDVTQWSEYYIKLTYYIMNS